MWGHIWCMHARPHLRRRDQLGGGSRSKERDRKSELVLRSTYQTFEWDRNNSDRNFYNVVRYVHIPPVPWMQERSDVPYGHASMLLLGEGSEATEPYNKYDEIRPHSIRSLQLDQKVRPLSFRPEKFDLFTATRKAVVYICKNRLFEDENIMWGISDVCTLALTVAKTSSHYDRFAIPVPARSLLLFDLA